MGYKLCKFYENENCTYIPHFDQISLKIFHFWGSYTLTVAPNFTPLVQCVAPARWKTQNGPLSKLKGNSTIKNISPKINIYDKWSYVSVIKLTMQIRYRRILTIKLLISHSVFLHRGGSSRPSSLFLYLCLFVDVDMVNRNGCSYVLSCLKTCVVSTVWQEIPQSFDPHLPPFSIRNALLTVDLQQSVMHQWRHLCRRTTDVRKN